MQEKKFETNLMNDLTFKKLFASEETTEITRYFLNEVAGIDVKSVSLRPIEVYSAKKLANLVKENDILRTKVDLLVDFESGQLATIELQNKVQSFFAERSLFYMAKGYMTSYNEADAASKYSSLRSIYGINIVNFHQHPPEMTDEVMRYVLKNEKYNLTLRNNQTDSELWTLIFFELPKVNQRSTRLLQEWKALFLTGKVSKTAPEHLKRAAEFIAFENLGEEERQMYINFDEHEAIRHAELEGAKEQEREQVARNLLAMGLTLPQVSKATGLTREQILKIQKESTPSSV
ncbi:Rpn family recombination-promoting nuclease/putative transposase [Enterococcus olivae]